jgi:hypothetical protein
MPIVRKYNIPALFCALAVLLCALSARPYADMAVCDDGPYILMARTLANTGHIVYNGWGAPMLGWQLYLAAAFIKLFGFSFTAVRMSTVLVSVALAFVLQRTLVAAGITERNASIGTLALVLSPFYLILSVTFMSDITGLFGIVICVYGCLRALQASSDRATIGWIAFAVLTNAIFGSSRQISWLGILVMVPSTLWLLRSRRLVLLSGAALTLAGALFIVACMQWLKHQPYSLPEHLLPSLFPVALFFRRLINYLLDIPFLLLPILALFLTHIRKRPIRAAAISLVVIFLAACADHHYLGHGLEPISSDFVDKFGVVFEPGNKGSPPIFLPQSISVLLTLISLGGVVGLMTSFLSPHKTSRPAAPPAIPSGKELGIVLAPFAIAYSLLLLPRVAMYGISDRSLLALLVVAVIFLVRYYQDHTDNHLPLAGIVMVGAMAIYAIICTRNTFAFYRARVAFAAELRSAGIPDTSVDNGWEYNMLTELQHADHINVYGISLPANAYVRPPAPPAATCPMFLYDETPHIHPLYGVSFDPNACYGLAPFPPVHYSRWPRRTPGTLYAVRYTPSSKPLHHP